jgi:hypothetical protein
MWRETWVKVLFVVVVIVVVVLITAMASRPSSAQRRCLAAVETFGPPEMAATCRAL